MEFSKTSRFCVIISVLSCVLYFGAFWNKHLCTDISSSLKPFITNLTRVINKSTVIVKASEYQSSGHFQKQENRDEMSTLTGSKDTKDLMAEGPFDFLPKYRNPCWIADNTTPPIKCLPYFYLVGAPKCGTTDLYSRLTKHPSVSSEIGKEPHWLTRKYYMTANETLDNYIRFFRPGTIEIYNKTKQDNFHPTVFGDASASTLWDNENWKKQPQHRNLSEPLYTNADYLHHLNPQTKIIIILRNPVDRLYSGYLFFGNYNKSQEHFHKVVVQALDYFNVCLVNHSLRYCVYCNRPTNDSNILKRRMVIGIYSVHLKEYFRVFPRRQIHVVKMEEYSKNISSAMKDLFNFLELEPLPDDSLRQIEIADKQRTRSAKSQSVGEMLPKTRKLLEDFHRPYNVELVKPLGDKFNYNG